MTKFKVGDWVKAIKDYDPVKKGMTGQVIHLNQGGNSPIGIKWLNLNGLGHSLGARVSDRNGYYLPTENLILIKKGEIMTIENSKFALIYEQNADPIEYFKTETQAMKRIGELLEDNSVKRNFIYLVPLQNIKRVKANNFTLEKV